MAVANYQSENASDIHSPSFLRDVGAMDGRIRGRKFDHRSVYSQFRTPAIVTQKIASGGTENTSGGGAATGSTGDVNRADIGRAYFEYFIKGTQSILRPVMGTYGMDFGFDQNNTDGIELTNGIDNRGNVAFQPGVDPAFFFRCKFRVAQANGVNPCVIGWRKAGAYNATYTSYTDYASIGIIGSARKIQIDTNNNGGGHGVTDTTQTWADAATHELKVLVDGTGAVTYQIDGAAPTATATFTFQSGLTVIPYFTQVNNATTSGELSLIEWEAGYQ